MVRRKFLYCRQKQANNIRIVKFTKPQNDNPALRKEKTQRDTLRQWPETGILEKTWKHWPLPKKISYSPRPHINTSYTCPTKISNPVKRRSEEGIGPSGERLVLYSHLHVHAASQRHNIKDRRMMQEGRRKKTFLEKYSPLTLLQGSKGLFKGLHVRGCWRPNINFIFWPHCYDRHVVFFLFSWC